jgi:hypothetical protein
MNFDYKTEAGWLSISILLTTYAILLWKIYKKEVIPSPLSWLGWGLLSGTAFLGQLQEGAGAGCWITGYTSLLCIIIGIYAQKYKPLLSMDKWDIFTLISGIFMICLYSIAKQINNGIILLLSLTIITELIMYIPTIKKIYHFPKTESILIYIMSTLSIAPAILAIDEFSTATLLYPLATITINTIVTTFIFHRRKVLQLKENNN